MNVGSLSDDQLDFLLSRGVGYLVLHEDSFPEKVSPFPVGQVLEALRAHPRLKGIGNDGAIWAFKILLIPSGRAKPPAEPGLLEQTTRVKGPHLKYYFPARQFEFEELCRAAAGGVLQSDRKEPTANGAPPAAALRGTVTVPPSMTVLDLPLKWIVRARGNGAILIANVIGPFTNLPEQVKIDSPEWKWVSLAIPTGSGVAGVGAVVESADESVELDSIILSAGEWKSPEPGSRLELPASDFFHAGFTRSDGKSVTFRAKYEPSSIVFYGPKLPLDVGRYSIELVFESPAKEGTLLGEYNIRWRGDEADNRVPVVSGTRAVSEFDQKDNRAFSLAFNFQRTADVTIRKIILIRLE
jgi:hypothetical protein